jgi:hypothetical protein
MMPQRVGASSASQRSSTLTQTLGPIGPKVRGTVVLSFAARAPTPDVLAHYLHNYTCQIDSGGVLLCDAAESARPRNLSVLLQFKCDVNANAYGTMAPFSWHADLWKVMSAWELLLAAKANSQPVDFYYGSVHFILRPKQRLADSVHVRAQNRWRCPHWL